MPFSINDLKKDFTTTTTSIFLSVPGDESPFQNYYA